MNSVAGGQSLARVLAAIEGFFVRYGEWPTSVRLPPGYIEHLRDEVLPPAAFTKLTAKVALVPDPLATAIAQNSQGLQYNYGASGFSKIKPAVRAREWLDLDND